VRRLATFTYGFILARIFAAILGGWQSLGPASVLRPMPIVVSDLLVLPCALLLLLVQYYVATDTYLATATYSSVDLLFDLLLSILMFTTATFAESAPSAAWTANAGWLWLAITYGVLASRFIKLPQPSAEAVARDVHGRLPWIRIISGYYAVVGSFIALAIYFFERPKFNASESIAAFLLLCAMLILIGFSGRMFSRSLQTWVFNGWIAIGTSGGLLVTLWRWHSPGGLAAFIVAYRHRTPLAILALAHAAFMLLATVIIEVDAGALVAVREKLSGVFSTLRGSIRFPSDTGGARP